MGDEMLQEIKHAIFKISDTGISFKAVTRWIFDFYVDFA